MNIGLKTMTALALIGTAGVATAATMASLQHNHRVLLISAPSANAMVSAQRNALAGWSAHAKDRDLVSVEIIGGKVTGVSDTAAALRATYKLPASGFAIALVGKDGHVAYRSDAPVTAEQLGGTIDAMPMRKAGQR